MDRSFLRRPGPWAAVLWALAAALWLLDAAGRGAPRGLDRTAVVAAAAVGLWWLAGWTLRSWRRGARPGEGWRRVLLGLLALSFAVRFVGLDAEVGEGYYRDEGIYMASAQRVNDGRLLPGSFIYGHFTFYAGAFLLWLRGLFPAAAEWAAATLYGVHDPAKVTWLALRSLAALAGALTVAPVFAAARRIAGPAAAGLAGALIVFSPLYNEVAHVVISDVPAGFFAALSFGLAARLLDGERRRDYVLAGVAAGLAAGSKYPGGVVAVAIVALWLAWRWRTRRFGAGLLWAGAAAVVAFVAVMPALLGQAGAVFRGGGRDILFGVRQYAEGGWIGVQPGSNAAYYGGQMAVSFGWPAVALAAVGLVLLGARERRRLALMAAYPAVYLALLGSMSMVVKRNLQPVLPAVAVLLGAAAAGWLSLAPARRRRDAATAALAVAVLGLPVVATVAQDLRLSRPTTREVAVAWIGENVPFGASFVKESYTPGINTARHPVRQQRFAARFAPEELYDPSNDYLLLAGPAFYRFQDPANWSRPHHEIFAGRYEEMFTLPLVEEFRGGRTREGPYLALYRIVPPEVEYLTERRFGARELWVPRDGMRVGRRAAARVRFSQWDHPAVARGWFAPGSYRVEVVGRVEEGEGSVEVVTVTGGAVGRWSLAAGRAAIELPAPEKMLFYLRLPEGSLVEAVEVRTVE